MSVLDSFRLDDKVVIEPGASSGLGVSFARRDWVSHSPLGRMGDAAELAATAVWLASPAPGYVTGRTIVVDGGRTIT